MTDCNLIQYLEHANQQSCPLISLEVACGMITHDYIRMYPSHYERLSCKKICKFVGDNENFLVEYNGKVRQMGLTMYLMIDDGYSLRQIAQHFRNQGFNPIREKMYHGV